MYPFLIRLFVVMIKIINTVFKSKNDLIMANIVLRQQLSNYKAKKVKPKITDKDRSFWIALKQAWCKWRDVLIIVKPETVIDWQRRRFKKHWTKISTNKTSRKRIKKEIKELIYKIARENNWGAPRIYSELLMLGYVDVSQSTVSRCLRRYRSENPDNNKRQSWKTFLKNHREVIAAMDFFVVPTVNFSILYVFFVIQHDKRVIIHFNVTEHPTAQWVRQ